DRRHRLALLAARGGVMEPGASPSPPVHDPLAAPADAPLPSPIPWLSAGVAGGGPAFGGPPPQKAGAAGRSPPRAPQKAAPRAPKKKKLPGSGIPARKVIRGLVWARRFAQAGFFVLFAFLLFETAFRGTFSVGSDTPVRLPWPVEGFLLTDPFVAAMT